MDMTCNRWVYAAVGVVVLLFSGLIYAWSVLAVPIAEEFSDASQGALSLTFTICMTVFCLGGFIGGLLNGKINVKINVWVAAILFLLGFSLASRAETLSGLYLGYGVLAGFGSGLAYNAVMSTVSTWFPDKQGTISGVLLMGFGLGSFIIGKVYQAYTPAGIGGWRTSFMVMGFILCAVLAIGGFFFTRPPKGYRPVGYAPPSDVDDADGSGAPELNLTPLQMIRRSSFWFFFIWAILLSAAGLAVIAQGTGVVDQVGAGTVDASTAATIVGLISIFNGVGRVIFGGLFDRLGQRPTMLVVDAAFFLSMIIVVAAIMLSSMPVLVIGFICCGLSYGGITPTNSAFANAFYGSAHYPVNYPIINLNLIVASFGGTLSGMLYDMSGSYLSTFLALLVAIAMGTVCTLRIHR